MSFLGGLNPVSLLATSMLGPIGGIVAQLAQQVISQVGQQLIQQLGQQLGVPQGAIEDAKGIFADQLGGGQGGIGGGANSVNDALEQLGQATGASPAEIGQAQGDFQQSIDKILNDLAEGSDVKEAKGNGKVPSWLMAMAKALGGKMDKMAKDLEKMSKEISDGNSGKSTEFTAMSQQFSILSNAASTGLKAIGEAMSSMARKQ
ncbi:hypothetical protein AB2M62_14925 [Sphingomonas sp. MMS12-HWE2-04]|uniref:hypothetical protein n=1 Tax=Sphingomonas sp. MMS12-HWE2-04 TaxID=3234199 RepID=UPI00384D92BC